MTTIYVVTEGQYSDYHIVGLYSTIEMATKCKEAVNADDIEEFELDSGDFRLYDLGYKCWNVRFSGDVTEATECDYYQKEYPIIYGFITTGTQNNVHQVVCKRRETRGKDSKRISSTSNCQ